MADFRATRRILPHWELEGATYFVTFNTWEKMVLNSAAQQIVLEASLFFVNQRYQLFAIVVMPDHVHLLLQPLVKPDGKCWTLGSIMHSIKSYSAKQIPHVMTHIGTLWQPERFDRIIRNPDEFTATYEYIRQNPVKAGLVGSPTQYPYLWVSPQPSYRTLPSR